MLTPSQSWDPLVQCLRNAVRAQQGVRWLSLHSSVRSTIQLLGRKDKPCLPPFLFFQLAWTWANYWPSWAWALVHKMSVIIEVPSSSVTALKPQNFWKWNDYVIVYATWLKLQDIYNIYSTYMTISVFHWRLLSVFSWVLSQTSLGMLGSIHCKQTIFLS
jgi:hypothetical protein